MEKRKYILTCDLWTHFKQFGQVGYKLPDIGFFHNFSDELSRKIQKAFPDAEVVKIDVEEIAERILNIAIEKQHKLDGIIVSTCMEIASPRRGFTLEVNRLYDLNGQKIGIGPRPGYASINQQLAQIDKSKPIILLEDGVFTGSTLCDIIKRLESIGAKVEAIIIGFAFPKGLKMIREVYDGEIIAINQLDNLIDWMPDHDFFPLAPNCGRVLGNRINGNSYPVYDYNGLSFSIPYIYPYCKVSKDDDVMADWTSISNQKSQVEISYFCLQSAVTFYDELNKLNNSRITFRHLADIKPRISFPIAVKSHGELPSAHEDIGRYLHGIFSECW